MEDKDTLWYVPAIPNFVKTRLNTTTGLAPEKWKTNIFTGSLQWENQKA